MIWYAFKTILKTRSLDLLSYELRRRQPGALPLKCTSLRSIHTLSTAFFGIISHWMPWKFMFEREMRVEGPVFQAFIDSRCFGAGWPPLPEARPRWVTRKRERRPAAKLLARRSPRPRAVHHRHLYFHLNAWRSSLKPNTPIHVVGFDMFDFLHNKRS